MRKARVRKLNTASEEHILRLLAEGFTVGTCAQRFEVGESTICRIKKRSEPPSVSAPSSKLNIRRRYRTISPIKKQWLFHLLDNRANIPTTLTQLANKFHTSEKVISEAIASRKKLCPAAPGGRPHAPRGDWSQP